MATSPEDSELCNPSHREIYGNDGFAKRVRWFNLTNLSDEKKEDMLDAPVLSFWHCSGLSGVEMGF